MKEALDVSQNRFLRGMIAALTADGELEAVLGSVIELVTDATGGDVCVLHLWDATQERLVLRAAGRTPAPPGVPAARPSEGWARSSAYGTRPTAVARS